MKVSGIESSAGCAKRILASRPDYARHLPPDYIEATLLPAIDAWKFCLLCGDRAYMTWFRPVRPPEDFPRGDDFRQEGPLTWIVDVVAEPGVPAMDLGRAVSHALYVAADLADGERVLFLRWPQGRVGHITARRPMA